MASWAAKSDEQKCYGYKIDTYMYKYMIHIYYRHTGKKEHTLNVPFRAWWWWHKPLIPTPRRQSRSLS